MSQTDEDIVDSSSVTVLTLQYIFRIIELVL